MFEYPKIQTIFWRDPETRNKYLILGKYTLPEFYYLRNNSWIFKEKVDGTNTRLMWDGENKKLTFGGRTDEAQHGKWIYEKLEEITAPFIDKFYNYPTMCIYGELYGNGINKAGKKYCDDLRFIAFDVVIDNWVLELHNSQDICSKIGLPFVPILGTGTLVEALEMVANGFKSGVSDNPDTIAEGLVLEPETMLYNRKGERIMTKIKYKDFPHV